MRCDNIYILLHAHNVVIKVTTPNAIGAQIIYYIIGPSVQHQPPIRRPQDCQIQL